MKIVFASSENEGLEGAVSQQTIKTTQKVP